MVVSQIAGLATAFGTGELSGAGFGPNYTILMKLGYEFFAPRILEEMEKNPNVFFQDTLWFKKFQKQIKLYSDNVMKETLDTLLSIPQETIDRIANRFSEQLSAGLPVGGSPELSILIKSFEAVLKAFSGGITLNVAGLGSILPAAHAQPGHDTSGATPDVTPDLGNFQPIPDLITPHGPEQILVPPTEPPGFVDDRLRLQSEFEANIDAAVSKAFDINNKAIIHTQKNFNPPPRRRTSSSDLELKKLLAGLNQLSDLFKEQLANAKKDYAFQGNPTRLKFLLNTIKKFGVRQVIIIQHQKLYSI